MGQVVSLVGSGLTGFSLGVWIFQRTESVSQFALIILCDTLPAILISPLAGVVVDRLDRRRVMMLSVLVSMGLVAALAVLLLVGELRTWNIALAMVVGSISATFHRLSYSASISLMIPKQHLVRANAMVQLGAAAGQILSPLLAAVLLEAIQLRGVLLIDCISYLFALAALMLVRIPRPDIDPTRAAGARSITGEFLEGWHFIRSRPGLIRLMVFMASILICGGIARVLLVPLILRLASVKVAGMVSSLGGVGLLCGGILVTVWGGPKRRVHGVLGFGVLFGACLILAGSQTSLFLIGASVVGIMFGLPIIASSSQAIWQTKTPANLQGRVFAVRTTLLMLTNPLAYIVAGQLADKVFEPMLLPGGILAASVGRVIGVGPGRGVGFMLMVTGVVAAGLSISGYCHPALRLVEDELPDMIPDAPATKSPIIAGAGRL
jgi:MFS family permease